MQWYMKRRKFYVAEKEVLKSKYPTLKIYFNKEGNLIASGKMEISIDDKYKDYFNIALVFPKNYPYKMPEMYETDGRIEKSIYRHIFKDGFFCFGPRIKVLQIWLQYKTIDFFLQNFAIPYLANQLYFERMGEWANGDYAHSENGTAQYYKELTGFEDLKPIKKLIESILEGNKIERNEKCFCGSNKKIKKCHIDLYETFKNISDRSLLEMDLKDLTKWLENNGNNSNIDF